MGRRGTGIGGVSAYQRVARPHRLPYFFLMRTNRPLRRHAHTPIRVPKRPSGTQILWMANPGDKSPGYYRVSLRDEVSKLQGARSETLQEGN
jgi:hypothetical protein